MSSEIARFSLRFGGFLFECSTGDSRSVVSCTDWDVVYVFEICAFQAEPIVEVVFIVPPVSGFEFGAAY